MSYMWRLRQGESVMSRSELERLIDEWVIGRNAQRDRAVLKDRLLDGLTYEQLAEKYDMSVRQMQNIVYKRQDILFRHMPSE